MEQISGIYAIVNKVSGRRYIGSSYSILHRWKRHIRHLNSNRHDNKHLQRAWNKYGKDNFSFNVLLICDRKNCKLFEQRALDAFHLKYNINLYATGGSYLGVNKGMIKSIEARTKMSIAAKGHKSNTLGKHWKSSDETKAKISAAMKGNRNNFGKHWKLSEEAKLHIRLAVIGRKHSKETNQKISVAVKGTHWHIVDGKRKYYKLAVVNV